MQSGRNCVATSKPVYRSAANNCTPLTSGCSNVPTVQQLAQQQCLAGYNNSGAATGIKFVSLYNLATFLERST